jgi:hypothetical protein
MARGWRLKNNIAPILALILVVGAMFTTGSRAPIYTLVAIPTPLATNNHLNQEVPDAPT